jgi:hypothetical protein
MYRGTGGRTFDPIAQMVNPDRDRQLIRVPIYRRHHAAATLILDKRTQTIGAPISELSIVNRSV